MTYGHGQLDMLAWLSGADPDDDPMAPVCLPVRSRAWVWCLAHNLYSAACACRAFELGGDYWRWMDSYFEGYYDDNDPRPWSPGCGRVAP